VVQFSDSRIVLKRGASFRKVGNWAGGKLSAPCKPALNFKQSAIGLKNIVRLLTLGFLIMSAASQAQIKGSGHEVVGLWNVTSASLSQRPTGGERTVIFSVQEKGDKLTAKITNLRHNFVPVSDFSYDPSSGKVKARYGVFQYNLTLDGDRLTGSVTSPAGELAVRGGRQSEGDLRYRSLNVLPFEATRTGVVGHITAFQPPADEQDPSQWVLDRIESPEQWAIVVLPSALAIGFSNASDFNEQLKRHAGEEVDIHGVWEGERLRIMRIIFPSGGGHGH
jgi:hypothetical protein